ncbi:PASTA domain-containing protein [Candidatus Poribacteria bacterium]|nr:PASTA domain-containing protein [Candidatus Poribacteria bacterium]
MEEKVNRIKILFKQLIEELKKYITNEHIIAAIVSMMLVVILLGSMIVWMFSLGEDVVETPNLIGLDTLSALEALTPFGLGLKIEGQQYNNKYPKGYIVSQNPEQKEKVRKTRDIKVIISRGTEMVRIPNLAGLSMRHAKVALQQVGLIKGDEAYVNSEIFLNNRIIAHTPSPGTPVKRGVKINLLISTGADKRKYMMPDCIGKRIMQIEKDFNEIGLLSDVEYEYNPKFAEGTIIGQNPMFGTAVASGEKIKFKVTRKEIFSDKNKLTRYAVLYYIPPIGINKKSVKIIMEDMSDASREEVFNEAKVSPGERIELVVQAGPKSKAKIYLDDELIEEKTF